MTKKTMFKTVMDGYMCDEEGFIYKKQAGGVYKPLTPKRHYLDKHNNFYFSITIKGKKYSVKVKDLKKNPMTPWEIVGV